MARPVKQIVEQSLLLSDESVQFIDQHNPHSIADPGGFFLRLSFLGECSAPGLHKDFVFIFLLEKLIEESAATPGLTLRPVIAL